MKKYTAIIKTKTDGIDHEGRRHAYTYKYEADSLHVIYEQAGDDACDYDGISLAFAYDEQGRALTMIASVGGEIAVFSRLDYQERLDAAELYEAHKEDDVITLY